MHSVPVYLELNPTDKPLNCVWTDSGVLSSRISFLLTTWRLTRSTHGKMWEKMANPFGVMNQKGHWITSSYYPLIKLHHGLAAQSAIGSRTNGWHCAMSSYVRKANKVTKAVLCWWVIACYYLEPLVLWATNCTYCIHNSWKVIWQKILNTFPLLYSSSAKMCMG